MKERLMLDWVYAKQHADYMFGMQVGLEDLFRVATMRQKFVTTDDFLGNFICVFMNFGNLVVYLITWGLMFISTMFFIPSVNVSIFSDMAVGEDEAMIDFMQDAITANQQNFLDRSVMCFLLLSFVVVSFAVALALFFIELIGACLAQEMYMSDEH